MKKSLPYEIIAAVLAIFGAFFLVAVYMPVLKPVQTKIEMHQDLPSLGYYFVVTPIALAILAASWYFNRKAQKLKQDASKPAEEHLTLKWILFGIVVLIVLLAFLW